MNVSPLDDTRQLREAVVSACCRLRDMGHFVGTWGNIAVRVREGLLVTPTRLDYDRMTPRDLVVVASNGDRLHGSRFPSSETELHRRVLLARPDLGASVHTHSPYASAVSATGRSIPVFLEDFAQSIGGEVRCSRYAPGGRHVELAEAAVEAMPADSAAVLLGNHGAVVCGRDLDEAVTASQILEKAALAFLLSQALGGPTIIPPAMVVEERQRFLFKYGTAADQK